MDQPSSRSCLEAFAAGGATAAEAFRLFDSLPPVSLAEMAGCWRGGGLPTGHPMDGLLERFGWYGKRFDGPEEVHPLLFRRRGGEIFSLDPAFVSMGLVNRYGRFCHAGLFAVLGPLAATRRPTARLRMVEYRGVVTATMIYDRQPINDMFRRVDAGTLLGVMDLRGMAQPFWFILRRI